MYIPKQFNMEEEGAKRSFMNDNSFASMVTYHSGRPVATHLPFVLKAEGEKLYLLSHLAKANEQGDSLDGQSCLVIFTGPHAYISPQHYDRMETVPTWDYVAVHAYGRAKVLHQLEEKMESLESMIRYYEPKYQAQWSGLSEKYKAGMLKGLTAFCIEVTELQGQEKLSQNKSLDEKIRIVAQLSTSRLSEERALADYMKEADRRLKGQSDGAS